MKTIHIFTHRDLDGAASYLVAKWFLSAPSVTITYTVVSSANSIRSSITSWLVNNEFSNYDKVYFLDLDVYVAKDLIDHNNVTIIDHHLSHVNNINENGKYEKAKAAVAEYTSCCRLLYKLFSRKYDVELSNQQKLLIAICDDYDCYKLDLKYSKPLNWVFYGYNNSFDTFVTRFAAGFDGFNSNEKAIIRIEHETIMKQINNLDLYYGTLSKYIVAAGFADEGINDVHEYLLQEYPDVDITIIVMPKNNRVSFRKQRGCTAPLDKIAEKLCDGGGHEYAAGGTVTPAFEEFTKILAHEPRT